MIFFTCHFTLHSHIWLNAYLRVLITWSWIRHLPKFISFTPHEFMTCLPPIFISSLHPSSSEFIDPFANRAESGQTPAQNLTHRTWVLFEWPDPLWSDLIIGPIRCNSYVLWCLTFWSTVQRITPDRSKYETKDSVKHQFDISQLGNYLLKL